MLSRLASVVALGVFVALVGCARADDQEKFQGTWKPEKAVQGGMSMPAEELEKMSIEFKGNMAMPRHGEKQEKAAEFKLDASKKPKTIDISVPQGDKSEHVKGIYEFDGDTLKICFSKDGGERPEKFESAEGSKSMLIVLKRVKK
jgi:uncharacterized protein (TIGR03067 family)